MTETAQPDEQTSSNLIDRVERLQGLRDGRLLIAYVTSTRPGLESQMAMDQVPIIYRHLAHLSQGEKVPVDLFLVTNGGDGIVPWRLVTVLREFASEITVLVAHHAFSAGTLVAMGADRVLMHPMGMLGPIDPTVTTPFNPVNPQNPAERLGISVEDVASYIALVKDDVGIRHEDELVQAFQILAQQVNPLALGNVKRSTSQSRMMGEKLLRRQGLDVRTTAEIVEKLASQLYYHGHPIGRAEAREDLGLSFIEDATPDVADAMWDLYQWYVEKMSLEQPFNAVGEVSGGAPPAPAAFNSPPARVHGRIGPYSMARVDSMRREDHFAMSFDVVVVRDANGNINATMTPFDLGWRQIR